MIVGSMLKIEYIYMNWKEVKKKYLPKPPKVRYIAKK